MPRVKRQFEKSNYKVAVNRPYSYSLSPETGFIYKSLMIEVNKRVYMTRIGTLNPNSRQWMRWFGCINRIWDVKTTDENLTVGFIYDNDEIIPYTYNFMLAKNELEKEYGDRVKVYVKSNVHEEEMEDPRRIPKSSLF